MKSILKNIAQFFTELFGLDKFAKSEDGQKIQDSANDILKHFGKGPFFQTKKEKELAEKKAKEKERQNLQETAENTKRIAEALEKILNP